MNEVRKATLEDATYIADNLRVADRAELSLGNKDPHKVVLEGLRESSEAFVLIADSKPCFLAGVVENALGNLVWACGTPAVEDHVRSLLKASRDVLDDWMRTYKLLQNVVWTGNPVHIRWLEHMGFQFGEDLPYHETTYRYFYKGVNLCVPQAH